MVNNQKIKRQEIINVAIQEFASKGFDMTNINNVATMSGIGKGTIYLYFSSKKDLYLAAIQEIVEMFNRVSDTILQMNISPFEKLKNSICYFFNMENDYLPYLMLWSRHQFRNDPTFSEEVQDIFNHLRQPLCEIISEGVENKVFDTPSSKVTGYYILYMIIMLIPALQPSDLQGSIPKAARESFVIEMSKRLLDYKD